VCLQNGSSGNLVSTNVIHDMARYAITMKAAGHDNIIELKRIQNTNLETYDAGGIEVTQLDKKDLSGSEIRHNIICDTIGYSCSGPKQPLFWSWNIYLDSFADGYDVHDNICYRSNNGGIMFQGGKGNHVHNNIFVDGRVMQALITNFADNQRNCQLDHNVFCFSNPASLLFDTRRLDAEVITADNNLYWCTAGDGPANGGWDRTRLTKWQNKGFDADSLYADPHFVNPDEDDYALQPTSPAFRLGFEKIDTSKIAKPCGCRIVAQGPVFWGADAAK
jgi:parallel beta-helix repeat protein